MRVILDHNVPKRLRRFFFGIEVKTAREMEWAELTNGDLISAAERDGFDVMITADKNLEYQQNLEDRKLALIVLPTNQWKYVFMNSVPVVAALEIATPGSFQRVAFEGLPPRRRRPARA